MNKVLVVSDVSWWVFHKIYRAIKKYAVSYQVDVCNACDEPVRHENYDVVLFLCDYMPELIQRFNIPREKIIFAIRQEREIDHPFYSDPSNLKKAARIVAASNENIWERYSSIHPDVCLAPGGVDTDKFYYKKQIFGRPIRVGWSGSIHQWGEEFRGLPIIREACNSLGYAFNFALGNNQVRRTEDQMVEYYHNDIDIYVEMSQSAGRQNGLIEACSCGVPVISAPVGVAKSLIRSGVNGFISERNVEDLKDKLKSTVYTADQFGINMRKDIEEQWSWKKHVVYFEILFERIING